MRTYERLSMLYLKLAASVTQDERMLALFAIKQFMESEATDPTTVYASIQLGLRDLQDSVSDETKKKLKFLGYCYDEDLDDLKKMFGDQDESN